MNAGRDVERLITHWLAEEAEVRAPDRILHAARRSIDSTAQRRFVVAWREPMYLSPAKLAAMAAVLVVALAGGFWAGRSTAPSGVAAPPTSSPVAPTSRPTAEGVTLESYKAARNEICRRYVLVQGARNTQLEGLYDPETTAADRAAMIAVLTAIADDADAMAAELDALAAPPDLAEDHRANVIHIQDTISLIRQELDRLASGDLVGAETLDMATDPLSRQVEAYENAHSLAPCP